MTKGIVQHTITLTDLDEYAATRVGEKTFECDGCGERVRHADRYSVLMPRPSDPTDVVAILWTGPCCAEKMGATKDE